MRIYLDNNATTKPLDEVVRQMTESLTERWANPSSVHRSGQDARRAIELARKSVADLVNAKPREVTFTSGATESIDLALRGVLGASPLERPVLVTSAIEHEAVRDCARDLEESGVGEVRHVRIDADGRVDAEHLAPLIDDRAALVSIQWANNETGVIQPVEQIGRVCRERGVAFHCDATQWLGKMPARIDWGTADPLGRTPDDAVPIDLLSCSAHKMHGPKGAGALVARRGMRIRPRVLGTHELGRRGGTENVPGIVGFGVAARLAQQWLSDAHERERFASLRDRLERGVIERIPGAVINGGGAPRLWNTTNIGFPSLEAEALLLLLSEQGVDASAGAACSSGSLDPSPVLLAMGVPETVAHGSIRLSLSRFTQEQEISAAIDAIAASVERLGGAHAATA